MRWAPRIATFIKAADDVVLRGIWHGPSHEEGKIRILAQNTQRLEWQSWTWATLLVLGVLAIVSLFLGIVALVEGELAGAAIPIVVSLLAIVFFAFFAGKRRVLFDKDTGEITVEFRSLLRHRIEQRTT